NTLNGGAGADTLIGGLGNDFYLIDNSADVISEASASGGLDTINSSVTYSMVGAGYIENMLLTGTADINGTGNFAFNKIWGNSGANVLSGGAGDDQLDGQGDADIMIGGTGNDTFFVNDAGDVVTESAGEGTDTVFAQISYTLGANL